MKPKIIVIDSDRRVIRQIKNILKGEYEVFSALSINESYSLITGEPSIVIIDPMYPQKQGIAFIKSIRERSDCPIIAVSENGTERAAVSAIEAGADDYIRNPFFSDEFSARIRACVRRIKTLQAAKGTSEESCYINGELRVEFDSHTVFVNHKPIHLTKNEFKILTLLCHHSGKVLTYDFIIKSIWGLRNYNNTGILRVNITNLRKKIEKNPLIPEYILTENGIGYRMRENETALLKS